MKASGLRPGGCGGGDQPFHAQLLHHQSILCRGGQSNRDKIGLCFEVALSSTPLAPGSCRRLRGGGPRRLNNLKIHRLRP